MGVASLFLGFLSFVCMIAGFFTSMVPFVGSLFSFGGPVLGVAGIITGGVAMSRSRRETGHADGVAIGGLLVSAIGFLLSLIVALTCGLCNACVTASNVATGSGSASSGANPLPGWVGNEDRARLELSLLLNQVYSSCAADPSGAAASAYIFPGAVPTLQGSICAEVGPNTAAIFGTKCEGGSYGNCSTRNWADQGPDAQTLMRLDGNFDLDTCWTYTVPGAAARLTVCDELGGSLKLAVATGLGTLR